uniref:Uncharacterized protein n=1 Tax=Micrurus lemniscatus lemniscatus TaxID=129467 RepID=A0A2D4JF17_MICLE
MPGTQSVALPGMRDFQGRQMKAQDRERKRRKEGTACLSYGHYFLGKSKHLQRRNKRCVQRAAQNPSLSLQGLRSAGSLPGLAFQLPQPVCSPKQLWTQCWESQPRASQKQTRLCSGMQPPAHITKGAIGRHEYTHARTHTHTHTHSLALLVWKLPPSGLPGSQSLPAQPLKDTDGARMVHLSAGGLCRAGAAYLGAP